MDLNEFNTRCNVLAQESYRVIRHKINNFEDDSSNDEIAGFVKGVVALQTELFCNLGRELEREVTANEAKYEN